jgi:S1-C subfamily serine protease
VLTVAHVIAGADDVDVVLADGTEKTAVVVAIDRRKDLALLDVDADVTPLQLGPLRVGARGTFASWRSGRPGDVPFTATEAVNIESSDIDHATTDLRSGYAIEADILPGDSGSVLVSDGRAVAVVFARSAHDRSTGWATAVDEVRSMLATAGDTAVDVGVCPAQR